MSFGSLPSVLGNGGGVAISVIGGKGLFADGTAAAPSISFAAEPSTGWYRASAGTMALSLSGTQRLNLFYSSTIVKLRNTANNNEIGLVDAGAVQITAAGTNQNITLTPSGTGDVATSSNIVLGVANNKLRSGVSNGYMTPEDGAIGCVIYSAGGIDFRRNSGTQAMRLATTTGNLLIGTTTDSGALLQIGTNTTTSAGGMVFGTSHFLFRSGSNETTFSTGSTVNASFAIKANNETYIGRAQVDSTGMYLDAATAGTSLFLRTNGTTVALTLNSSQNATFAGNAVVGGGNAAGASTLTVNYSSATKEPIGIVNSNTGGKSWYVGDGTGTSNGNFGFRNATDSITTLIITSVGDGIFAGRIYPQQAVTASAPAYSKGAMYFDTTLNKLRIGGASAWETVTSV